MDQQLAQTNQKLLKIAEMVNDETPVSAPGFVQIGVDLGTADIQTLVVDQQGEPIAAFLDWADVVRDGIVVDYFGACQIVRSHIAKVENKLGIKVTKAITSYPPGTDPRISINVVESAGVEVTKVIDEPASVAALLNIQDGAVVDVGGGTTGTAILHKGQLVESLDEPSGGRHVTLCIAGAMQLEIEQAELLKRKNDDPLLPVMAKPVIEKMSDIVAKHIEPYQIPAIYLTGGGSLISGFADVFKKAFPQSQIVEFSNALYLTPLAIACYGLEEK